MESPLHVSVVASRSVHAIIMLNARQDIVAVKFVVFATTQKTGAIELVGKIKTPLKCHTVNLSNMA